MKNETALTQEVRMATQGQLKDINATLIQAVPNLTFEQATIILRKKGDLVKKVQDLFPIVPTNDLAGLIKSWEQFYDKNLGLTVDLSGVQIPEKREGFDRLIIVAEGLTQNQVYTACEKHFPCYRYMKDLDKDATLNERTSEKAYAIWVRDTVEADEIRKNKSADMEKEGLTTETLLERMLHELKYFLETGKHLDIDNWTLCSGSRGSGGGVPGAYWSGGGFCVRWCSRDDRCSYLRPRQAITL